MYESDDYLEGPNEMKLYDDVSLDFPESAGGLGPRVAMGVDNVSAHWSGITASADMIEQRRRTGKDRQVRAYLLKEGASVSKRVAGEKDAKSKLVLLEVGDEMAAVESVYCPVEH
jgi:hypothetical protein